MSKLQFVHFIVSWHGNCYGSYTTHEACIRQRLRANLHFTLWMCNGDDSSKVKGVKAVFIRISSKVNIQSDQ